MSDNVSLLAFTAAMSVLIAVGMYELMLGISLSIVLLGLTRRAVRRVMRPRGAAIDGAVFRAQSSSLGAD
jgi:hypothetical protein